MKKRYIHSPEWDKFFDWILSLMLAFLVGWAAAMVFTGCAGTEARALVWPTSHAAARLYSDQDCQRMLARRRSWGALGAGASFAGGGSGVVSAFPNVTTDWRYVVGGVGVSFGIFGAIAAYLSRSNSDDFSQFCTTAPGAAH